MKPNKIEALEEKLFELEQQHGLIKEQRQQDVKLYDNLLRTMESNMEALELKNKKLQRENEVLKRRCKVC